MKLAPEQLIQGQYMLMNPENQGQMNLTVERVSTTQGFRELRDAWDCVFAECPWATIFSSWTWAYTWWDIFGVQYNRKLLLLCVYDENQKNRKLVGIAPFQIVKSCPESCFTGRTIRFIGSEESSKDIISTQFNDLIITPGYENRVSKQIVEYLQRHLEEWDFADFSYLLEGSVILKQFTDFIHPRHCVKKLHQGYRYSIPRVKNLEAYIKSLKKRWRKMYRKKCRSIEREGNVRIQTTETSESVDAALQLLAEMHGARWIKRTGSNIFDEKLFYQFHYRILKQLVPDRKAFIKTLYLNNEPLASYYAFTDKGQVHYYQSGFFSARANRFSPLFLLVCSEIGAANEQNKLFDFMYSEDENCYKHQQYAAKQQKMYRLLWSHQKFRFIIFENIRFLKNSFLKYCDRLKALMSKGHLY